MGHKRSSVIRETAVFGWIRRQPVRVKWTLGAVITLLSLVALKFLVPQRDHFFVLSEAVHFAGIIVLIFKLSRRNNTCSGLSLNSQELTAIFLTVRLYCSFFIEYDIHTILDFATLVSTVWVIYMMRYKLKSTYTKELDDMPRYYTVVPSLVLAMFIHPYIDKVSFGKFFWAFSVYLESVSVLPQLRLMQNAKMVEPFTANYVFALGIARFLGFAHWIIKALGILHYVSGIGIARSFRLAHRAMQLVDTRGTFLLRGGYLWFPAAFLAELVQTFILADFCYYYVQSRMSGQLLMKMPV